MSIERNMVIAILKLTRNGPVTQQLINNEAKTPSQIAKDLLRKLQKNGLLYLHKDIVEINAEQRLRLAVYAIDLGADLEQTSSLLGWQEFEGMAAFALERNGYRATKNLRFKYANRKWEIDVVGCRRPLVICIDCKHWHHGASPSTLRKIVEEQTVRTQALANSLPSPTVKIECASWEKVKFIPVVLSLVVGRLKFHADVPVVPVLQLQDFLAQLPMHVDTLKHFIWSDHNVQNRFS